MKLSQTEFQEYLHMSESPEKARKAEELLSRVMMLFLADLGMKLAPSANAPVTHPPEGGASEPAPETAAHDSTTPTSPPSAAKPPASRPWVESEFAILRAPSDRDAVQSLNTTEITDLFSELKASVVPNSDQAGAISGDYFGQISFKDNSPPWDVEWHVDARLDNAQLHGKVDIKIFKQGVLVSNTSSNGTLRGFSAGAGGSNAIFVEAYGASGYMQLYPMERDAVLVGNYYIKKGLDQFTPAGTVVLRKR